MNNFIISDDEVDQALMSNITNQWRKVAYVVMKTFFQIDVDRRTGLMDLYFAERIFLLVEKGFIEYQGTLGEMRECEVRQLQNANTAQK